MIEPVYEKPKQRRRKMPSAPIPLYRCLRGYAFDPILSLDLETVFINEVVFKVRWEDLEPRDIADDDSNHQGTTDQERDWQRNPGLGPVGEYLEVVDYDPASGAFYEPVDLNDPRLLGQNGLPPSEGNPQFHQQMAYAVAMTTIANFERALGRWALWAPNRGKYGQEENFVQRLRIYPHALRQANAYYDPKKVALLFGYFPARPVDPASTLPGGTVFTCLSHDIIAHETTHALLDGMYRRFIEPSNPDVLAFHEAFADIVALFQHFSFPEVLRHQIGRTRGDLSSQNLLGELAQEFGKASGRYGALRSVIGQINPQTKAWEPRKPEPAALEHVLEPHARGAILVAAVFDAFLKIYTNRVADLMRIASNGSGILAPGNLHPDLVNRLADEASKAASHVLQVCIRALDYCPPLDITFGEYLRAIVTADYDMVPDDDLHYRLAFVDAFRRHGIYPSGLRTYSEESLRWPAAQEADEVAQALQDIGRDLLAEFFNNTPYFRSRKEAFDKSRDMRRRLHAMFTQRFNTPELDVAQHKLTGIVLTPDHPYLKEHPDHGIEFNKKELPKFEVHALRIAQRATPDGSIENDLIIVLNQQRSIDMGGSRKIPFRGGATLILDAYTYDLRYAISRDITDDERLRSQINLINTFGGGSLFGTYFSEPPGGQGPFALLHSGTS
ncbi:MAG: hypothetical protein H7Y32_20345 [Chloroflexales bacterium]|nr:hypothetical protein [Chloroflexales bacterium]